MIPHFRNQLRLDALRRQDRQESEWVAKMIGLGALVVLIGVIVLLRVF